jgi:hypothetical protein
MEVLRNSLHGSFPVSVKGGPRVLGRRVALWSFIFFGLRFWYAKKFAACKNYCAQNEEQTKHIKSKMIVTFAGDPNSGKITIFNEPTGACRHAGNYPGVAIER